MAFRKSLWITLSVLLLQEPPGAGSIEGVVLGPEGRAIARADVTALIAPAPAPAYLPPRTFTDSNGRFTLNLAAGTYRIRAEAPGYARQEYGAVTSGLRGVNTGAVVDLRPGQTLRGVNLRLSGNAIVSGRINGPDGEPLSGMEVGALLKIHDETGGVTFRPDGNFGKTDDRGEFRIAGLTPGRYCVRASMPAPGYDKAGGAPPAGASPGRYEAAYYPGAAEADAAMPIDLESGTEVRNVDFSLPRLQLYRVRGRVRPPAGEPIAQPVTFVVQPRKSETISSPDMFTLPVQEDGVFELTDIPSGEYRVMAVHPSRAPSRGYALVRIFDSDAEGIEIDLIRDVTISGSLRVEGEAGAVADWDFLRIELRAGYVPAQAGLPSDAAEILSGGTFEFRNKGAMEYRLAISNLPPELFVKEARFGDIDALTEAMQVNRAPVPQLDIVMARGFEIAGTAVDLDGRRAPLQTVVLIPEQASDRADLYRTASTDFTGHFMFSGVAPGNYRLFAWRTLDPFQYFDRDFVSVVSSLGTPVRVGNGIPGEAVDVLVIPSEVSAAIR